jgi:hypothetical protein
MGDTIDVMVDLETMSTQNNASIVSIGAVVFSKEGVSAYDGFYRAVSLESCQKLGLHIEAGTVMWWMKQSSEARAALAGGSALATALQEFTAWVHQQMTHRGAISVRLWGNGATFDNVILRSAYAAAGLEPPWKFWNDRCYRTLRAQYPDLALPDRGGVHHNALDDAKYQAECAVVMLISGDNK